MGACISGTTEIFQTVVDSSSCLRVLWARHKKPPEVDRRDWRVTMRLRTMQLLNTVPVSHMQTHFKSHTCCLFVHVTSD